MTLEVYPRIYQNEIPLPGNPLKAINSYIITSGDRNLIIDTGFNSKECKDAFMEGLKKLNIDLSKTDLFITHLHSDHCGLAAALNKEGVSIYTGKIDGEMINNMTSDGYWKRFEEYGVMFDLAKDNITFDDHPVNLLQAIPFYCFFNALHEDEKYKTRIEAASRYINEILVNLYSKKS